MKRGKTERCNQMISISSVSNCLQHSHYMKYSSLVLYPIQSRRSVSTTARNKQKNIDTDEVHKFAQLSKKWWDPYGPLKPLHQMNGVRLKYVKHQCQQHFTKRIEDLSVLDVGCGGGILTESLCRLGVGSVTGIDAAYDSIKVANEHASHDPILNERIRNNTLAYKHTEQHCNNSKYDVLTALEVIEHVPDYRVFLDDCIKYLRPNGLLFISTINRTTISYILTIVGAEYILKWIPIGTHDWNKFVTPNEIAIHMNAMKFNVHDCSGMTYNPLKPVPWSLDPNNIDVNYIMCCHAQE